LKVSFAKLGNKIIKTVRFVVSIIKITLVFTESIKTAKTKGTNT